MLLPTQFFQSNLEVGDNKLDIKNKMFSLSPKTYHLKPQQGFIALIALLVIAAAGLTIGLSVSLVGIEELQITLSHNQSARARALANSCIEEGLERLRNDFSNYAGTLSIDGDSCIINVTVNGSTAFLSATGTFETSTQIIKVDVNNNLEVTSWQEK